MKSIRAIAFASAFVLTCCLVRIVNFDTEKLRTTIAQFGVAYPFRKDPLALRTAQDGAKDSTVRRFVSKNSDCLDEEINWSRAAKPKYKMDPTRLLIPTLYNGPNNQMMGFQQSILLSLLLNRTLVLPVFYQHEIDKDFRTIVPVQHRLNVQKLREYISVVPLHTAVKICNSNFDAIFAQRSFNIAREVPSLLRISIETGFRGVEFVDDVGHEEIAAIRMYLFSEDNTSPSKFRNRKWWPKNKTDRGWTSIIQKPDSWKNIPILPKTPSKKRITEVRTIYSTDAKCVLHWFPFRQYLFKKPREYNVEEVQNIDLRRFSEEDGWKLLLNAVMNTQSPESVLAWSKQFRNEYLCKQNCTYLSIHWRFDSKDFFGYICRDGLRQDFCESVRKATDASAIAKAILMKMADIHQHLHTEIDVIYIAAPPTLDELIHGIASTLADLRFVRNALLSNLPTPKIFTSKHLKPFILERYRDCEMTNPLQLSDTISQIEMDICARGYAFLWSRQSTWSSNANRIRYINKMGSRADTSALEFVLDTMKKDDKKFSTSPSGKV